MHFFYLPLMFHGCMNGEQCGLSVSQLPPLSECPNNVPIIHRMVSKNAKKAGDLCAGKKLKSSWSFGERITVSEVQSAINLASGLGRECAVFYMSWKKQYTPTSHARPLRSRYVTSTSHACLSHAPPPWDLLHSHTFVVGKSDARWYFYWRGWSLHISHAFSDSFIFETLRLTCLWHALHFPFPCTSFPRSPDPEKIVHAHFSDYPPMSSLHLWSSIISPCVTCGNLAIFWTHTCRTST